MDTRQIVDFAFNDDAKGMRDALYSNIHDRVMDHIEKHKQQLAQGMITQESEVEEVKEEEPAVTESKIDDLKDKQAAEKDKDWWGDKEKKGAKPTKTLRQIAGKKDSGAKHDDEDEDKK